MAYLRIFISRSILVTFLLLKCFLARSQGETEAIDTSDYLPYYFPDADAYNLLIAASKGYSGEIEKLLKKGADIEVSTTEGATPLVLAVNNNRISAVNTLIANKANVNRITNNHETPVLIAARRNFTEIAEKLIRAGADVDFRDTQGATPLHYAALYGYMVMTDLLIYYNANTEIQTIDGSTPLHGAISAANYWVADLLVQRGAYIEAKDNDGLTPFLMAAFYGDTVLMNMLNDHGANKYSISLKGFDALDLAIISGDADAVRYILQHGEWQKPVKGALDPYEIATKYGRKEMVEILKSGKVVGKVKRQIDQAAITLSSRISPHDFYTGFSLTFTEPSRNIGFLAGIDTKLWYTRVLYKESSNTFYQFMDKSSMAYAGVFKEFRVAEYSKGARMFFRTALSGGYIFGNNLKGTTLEPDKGFRMIPSATFRLSLMKLDITAGLEYTRSKFYKTGPIWFRAGISYNYFFDNIRTRIKPISWYKQ